MRAFVFPGQGSQFVGMGEDLYRSGSMARQLFEQANDQLGFSITEIMFKGTDDDLKQTRVTQPAIFLHAVIAFKNTEKKIIPQAVAGHSLGEFSALVASQVLSFTDALVLVQARANAMQAACKSTSGVMAAVVGLEDSIVEKICLEVGDLVPANYNCPGQLVVSGSSESLEKALPLLEQSGARKVIPLQVGGAFHSPFMLSAQNELKRAIDQVNFKPPVCPIYQNVSARGESDPNKIKENLIAQLTSPVKWAQSIKQMIQDGISEFIEFGGSGKVLQGMIKRIDREVRTASL